MDVQSIAYRTDLALLELGGSVVEDRGDRLVVRTPHNPTFHWGNFLLLDRPPAAADVPVLLADVDATFPDSTHRAIGVDGPTSDPDALAPLVAAGLSLDVAAVMTARATQAPPRPNADATYRPLASDEDWQQRVALAARCNEDHPADEYLAFMSSKARTDRALTQAGHGAWWGAFVDGRLVSSLGLFRAGEGSARFQSVETDPAFRGRGLAGTLVHETSRWGLAELDVETLVMVADPDYVAIRIYRSVGFAETERQTQLHQPDRRVSRP
ncbi:GNAT family N-acetyltransferase [Nocardioides sp. CER19]|uniref:GNAT family N-acetyltransferase n=1 Tax=Nocardioides sp. CER19 TaxID=3038538 RepID=UPI00244A21B5|nr:GNAT family N-acetyltransferase [Nocardioides sp. CER19]MDH2415796.1 GNAT family N-acetyltransferase [Nocardioides sp. CER19]